MFVGPNAVPNQSQNVGTELECQAAVPSASDRGKRCLLEIRLARTVYQVRVVLFPVRRPPQSANNRASERAIWKVQTDGRT